jgi:hypothetical protein
VEPVLWTVVVVIKQTLNLDDRLQMPLWHQEHVDTWAIRLRQKMIERVNTATIQELLWNIDSSLDLSSSVAQTVPYTCALSLLGTFIRFNHVTLSRKCAM